MLIVGTRIAVFWPLDDEWYSGTVGEFDNARQLHSITYDDDEHAWLDLSAEDFKVLDTPTQSNTETSSAGCLGKNEGTDDAATIGSISSLNDRNCINSDKTKLEVIVDPVEALRAKEEALLQQDEDENSLLNVHIAVHAVHAAEQRQMEDDEKQDEELKEGRSQVQDSTVGAAIATAEACMAESSSSGDENIGNIECEPSTADKSSESTPTTVTAGVGEMDKANVGRSKSVLKVLAKLKNSVDVIQLNNKYKQDISAAAALAATIAAYAEENDDSSESKMLSQEQSEFDDQFDIGDMDFGDDVL